MAHIAAASNSNVQGETYPAPAWQCPGTSLLGPRHPYRTPNFALAGIGCGPRGAGMFCSFSADKEHL